MLVLQVRVGPMENFVYILVDEKSREAMVVDSGWETGPILKAAEEARARVKYAVATHGHFDHTSTLRELADAAGARVVAHRDSPIECDERAADGDELPLGGSRVKVLHTPGHTQDSICLYDGKELFSGDTLFVGSIGRIGEGMGEEMFRSLWETIMKLPPSTTLYPGHDYGEVPARTLGEEAASNPYLGVRDLRSFLSFFS